MNFLHSDFYLNEGDIVEVTLDGQANVRLLDDSNFSNYQRGSQHSYYGGLAKVSPTRLRVPHLGHWHVVIDLGGYAGTVRSSVKIIKAH